jgi:hypothetical protein
MKERKGRKGKEREREGIQDSSVLLQGQRCNEVNKEVEGGEESKSKI